MCHITTTKPYRPLNEGFGRTFVIYRNMQWKENNFVSEGTQSWSLYLMRQNDWILNQITRPDNSKCPPIAHIGKKKSRFLFAREGHTTTKMFVLRSLARTYSQKTKCKRGNEDGKKGL